MNLILHPDTATTFDNNGIGVLADAITSKVVRELNGQYELMLKYPDTGLYAEFITDRHIIMAKPDPVTDPQPFRIYRVNPVSKGTITAYARHIAYDTMGIPCAPFTAASCADAVKKLSANAATDCPFTFITDKTTSGNLTTDVPKAIWNILGGSEGSILDRYGGEYNFDGYNIALYARLGADRGVSIRYGKNLSTLEQDRNCANVYTGVFPYWKPYEGDVVMLPEQIINAAGTYNFARILPLDLSEKFDAAPTEEQLRKEAERYMARNNIGVPDISWTVQFVQLELTEEYKGMALLEQVLLGDTVSVVFPRMNVNASARAVGTDFDPILERYNSITLGRVRSNIASTIVKQQQDISQKASSTAMQNAMTSATSWLTNGKGYKVERRDAGGNTIDTLYMDTPDINTAVNVLRIGQSGIGFSKTGVNGPYVSAWTIDGKFNADFISGLELFGVTVRAGSILSEDGKLEIDLSSNNLAIQTENNLYEDYSGYLVLCAEGVWATNKGKSRNNGVFQLDFFNEGAILSSGEKGKFLHVIADTLCLGGEGQTVRVPCTLVDIANNGMDSTVNIGDIPSNASTRVNIRGENIDIGCNDNSRVNIGGNETSVVDIGGYVILKSRAIEWVYSSELGRYVLAEAE